MTWQAETDPVDDTWADTDFRDHEGGRLLWLRAGDLVSEPAWLLQTFAEHNGVRTVDDEHPVTVADAVALAPEVAHDVMRTTRGVLERYARHAPADGLALAEELRDAARELEREDVPAASSGTHTKRGEDVVPPVQYEA